MTARYCSQTHIGPAHHHVYGYEHDDRGNFGPPVAERGVAIADCAIANAMRDSAVAERPDLDWCVEWRLMR